jgi:hypothetical protein
VPPLRIVGGVVEGVQPDGSFAPLATAGGRPLTDTMLDTLEDLIAADAGRSPPEFRHGNPYDALNKAEKRMPGLVPYILRAGTRQCGKPLGRVRLCNPHSGGHCGPTGTRGTCEVAARRDERG